MLGVGRLRPRPVRNERCPTAGTADTSAAALRHTVQVPDTCGRTAASGVAWRLRWLEEPVVGVAVAGGMQPAPVDAGEPGGQPAAELAADIGHRRTGERAGLLQAEVVDLQPSDLAVLPAADDRLGDLFGVDADLRPGVQGPSARLTGEIGHEHRLTWLPFRWPVSSW
jgi:hypothetical protein